MYNMMFISTVIGVIFMAAIVIAMLLLLFQHVPLYSYCAFVLCSVDKSFVSGDGQYN